MQLTFTKAFGPNTKPGAKWVRWDYKTGDDTRFVHFAGTQEIPLNAPVNIEAEDNKITSWSLAEGNQQATPTLHTGPHVRIDYTAAQGPSERDAAIHRQTATKVAAQLLQHLEVDKDDPEAFLLDFFGLSGRLAAYYATGETLPF